MASFQHILITRFNLQSATRSWTDMDTTGREKWMEHRWKVFTNYCLLSILNQSTKNFLWFIYFDKNTNDFYKEKIIQLAKDHPFISPHYVESYEQFLENLSSDILKTKKDKTTHIISSRIDNDDAFHRDAIGEIQAQFASQNYQLINLAKGACLNIDNPYGVSSYTYYAGPFISLIERIPKENKVKTIYEKDHHFYFTKYPIIQLKSMVYWIQVIHKYNVSNGMRGKPVRMVIGKEAYGFEVKKPTGFNYILISLNYYFLRFPQRVLRNNIRSLMGKPIAIK